MKIHLIGTSWEIAKASVAIEDAFRVIETDALYPIDNKPGELFMAMEVENR